MRKLGKGNFATVYEVERLEDGKKYAVKAFSKNTCFSTPKGKEGLINELVVMRSLSKDPHENLLKLEAVF
jgi:serine/threonine protein kinase